ncbi:hypothetical protein G4B88_011435 [Cannabis sativa]|uniref:Uncharacterized protein n=1 Tax=Cannabis sativa TaxID=3483 RepID=A0A7J6GI09_CANSA|nr:hypothetical protein G4B88_011435 [Cannabis sativa]
MIGWDRVRDRKKEQKIWLHLRQHNNHLPWSGCHILELLHHCLINSLCNGVAPDMTYGHRPLTSLADWEILRVRNPSYHYTPDKPSKKPMWKGVLVAYAVVAVLLSGGFGWLLGFW